MQRKQKGKMHKLEEERKDKGKRLQDGGDTSLDQGKKLMLFGVPQGSILGPVLDAEEAEREMHRLEERKDKGEKLEDEKEPIVDQGKKLMLYGVPQRSILGPLLDAEEAEREDV